MTDEEIRRAIIDAHPNWMDAGITSAEIDAYRLGWQARGRRDQEVCRERTTSTSKGLYEQGYTAAAFACALAIARAD